MSALRTVLVAAATFAVVTAAPPAEAIDVDGTYLTFDVQVTGGVVLDFEHLDETGNAFSFSFGVDWYHFRVAVGVAGVLPASNVEGAFELVWVEGLWYPFGGFFDLLTPYIVAGVGVATADSIDSPRPPDSIPPPAVRWSPRNPRAVGIWGIGVSYGDVQGLYGSVDFRAYNISHGGLNLGIGYRF